MSRLSKKEAEWFNGLQDYLMTAPKSIKRKVSKGEISSYTTGDFDITIFDQESVSNYEDASTEIDFDTPVSVEISNAKLETIFFPFRIESCAG